MLPEHPSVFQPLLSFFFMSSPFSCREPFPPVSCSLMFSRLPIATASRDVWVLHHVSETAGDMMPLRESSSARLMYRFSSLVCWQHTDGESIVVVTTHKTVIYSSLFFLLSCSTQKSKAETCFDVVEKS